MTYGIGIQRTSPINNVAQEGEHVVLWCVFYGKYVTI